MTMNKLLTMTMIATICVLTARAHAGLDAKTQDSLDQTRRLLTTPSERNAAIANDPEARDADAKAGALGSPAVKEKVYAIAADIAKTMVEKDADGFAGSAGQLKASDPKALFESLTPEQKQAIERLAKEIEAARK